MTEYIEMEVFPEDIYWDYVNREELDEGGLRNLEVMMNASKKEVLIPLASLLSATRAFGIVRLSFLGGLEYVSSDLEGPESAYLRLKSGTTGKILKLGKFFVEREKRDGK